MKVYHEVNDSIDVKDLDDVQKVPFSIVKEAIKRLNNNKTDPSYDFRSDCLKNGPEILSQHMSIILQARLIHSQVSNFLLLAVLV